MNRLDHQLRQIHGLDKPSFVSYGNTVGSQFQNFPSHMFSPFDIYAYDLENFFYF